ncbi:MAG: ribonuclease HI [Alphaproteobacteria bacterium]|nr:ribonuclease HI [Alphaproteobacteria bacterium]
MTSQTVNIYTDGACTGNPGPGGWGAVLKLAEHQKEIFGYEADTTNNRMEMLAAIQALETLKKPSKVILHTDSRYLKDGISLWVHKWQTSGWLTADKKPVKNKDLWERLLSATKQHNVEWMWVKGHSGHVENERADFLARNAIIGAMVESA